MLVAPSNINPSTKTIARTSFGDNFFAAYSFGLEKIILWTVKQSDGNKFRPLLFLFWLRHNKKRNGKRELYAQHQLTFLCVQEAKRRWRSSWHKILFSLLNKPSFGEAPWSELCKKLGNKCFILKLGQTHAVNNLHWLSVAYLLTFSCNP